MTGIPLQYLEKNKLLRTCREFLRECSDLKLPSPSFLNGRHYIRGSWRNLYITQPEGVTVISEDTFGQLLTTFDNVEQEEFFEVIELEDFTFWCLWAGVGQHGAGPSRAEQQTLPQTQFQASHLFRRPEDKSRSGTHFRDIWAGRNMRDGRKKVELAKYIYDTII